MTRGLTVKPFRVVPISGDHLVRIRARGVDDFDNPVVARPAEQGAPLRCCLRDAEAGEQVALIAYQPASVGGPYAEVGPIFVHAEACHGWTGDGYPDGVRHRQQLLRAYDGRGNQVDNVIAEPGGSEAAIVSLLSNPTV